MKKIIFLLISLFSIIGFGYDKINSYSTVSMAGDYGLGISVSEAVAVEWVEPITNKINFSFGPELGLQFKYNKFIDLNRYSFNIDLTGRGDFEINFANNHRINNMYVGLEAGFGMGYSSMPSYYTQSYFDFTPIFKLQIGTQINPQLKIGGFVGYGKGVLGLEIGYKII